MQLHYIHFTLFGLHSIKSTQLFAEGCAGVSLHWSDRITKNFKIGKGRVPSEIPGRSDATKLAYGMRGRETHIKITCKTFSRSEKPTN
jgi:hypothetical protein